MMPFIVLPSPYTTLSCPHTLSLEYGLHNKSSLNLLLPAFPCSEIIHQPVWPPVVLVWLDYPNSWSLHNHECKRQTGTLCTIQILRDKSYAYIYDNTLQLFRYHSQFKHYPMACLFIPVKISSQLEHNSRKSSHLNELGTKDGLRLMLQFLVALLLLSWLLAVYCDASAPGEEEDYFCHSHIGWVGFWK